MAQVTRLKGSSKISGVLAKSEFPCAHLFDILSSFR